MTLGDLPRDSIHQPTPIILPDPGGLFVRRAARLRALADGHPMADWLRFLARIMDRQQIAADAMPSGGGPGFALQVILEVDDAPEQARAVFAALRSKDPGKLADAWLRGEAAPGEAVIIAAALQVEYTCRAAAQTVSTLQLTEDRRHCPVCGWTPVAGVITEAGPRYLHWGLCATAWNHVRAVCTGCGESKGLAVQTIEGGSTAVKAETCDGCHGYAKMLYQAEDMAVEPMADDLASLGLDLLVNEAGWSRLYPNPLVG